MWQMYSNGRPGSWKTRSYKWIIDNMLVNLWNKAPEGLWIAHYPRSFVCVLILYTKVLTVCASVFTIKPLLYAQTDCLRLLTILNTISDYFPKHH